MSKRRPPAKPTPLPPARTWLAVFAIAALVAFSSAIKAPFEYDDLPAIDQNASIHDLFSANVFSPPPQSPTSGRPVVNLSLALNYAINDVLGVDQRPDPYGPNKTVSYHIANLAVHLACALLLFGIIRRTLRRRDELVKHAELIAGGATLLWLLHPIQTEAVHYLIQRTELIVSAFYAATLYAAIRAGDSADSRQRNRWYVIGVIACALGMLSKEVMVTAPLMVVLYDRAFRADSWRALWRDTPRVRFYAGLFATTLLVVASIVSGARDNSVGFELGTTPSQYFLTQAWAVAHYLRLIAWPSGLAFDYGYVPVTDGRVLPGLIVLSALFLASLWAWTRPRTAWLGFCGAWFFLILAPSSSIVPIVTEIAAERRVYLASIALFVLLALAIHALARRAGVERRAVIAATAGLAVALAVVTFTRGLTYSTPERLFRDNVANAQENPRADVSLAMALARLGPDRMEEAKASVRNSIAKDSNYFVAWRTLGFLESSQGRFAEALPALERAVRLKPDHIDANVLTARTLIALGRTGDAIPYVDKIGSVDAKLLWSVGTWLVDRGEGTSALTYLEKAAATSAGAPPVIGIGLISLAYAQSGRPEDAIAAARAAVRAAGDTADAFVLAGEAMAALKLNDDARAYLRHALALDPSSALARRALVQLGDR